jgi:polar amino acid transport system permease protein/polar amino acid transport system substrate-binding protein
MADRLADVRQRGVLQWGGDQEGGGPYVYPRQDDPNQVTGFEVELAARLAEYLQVRAEFTQGQWDNMPDMLRTGKVDIILNGYELTPQRLELMDATIPYYVYRLQLLARRGDPRYLSWESLKAGPGRAAAKIGVLTGSAAEAYMRRFCADATGGSSCEVISYDGNTDTMREVETGKLDATLEDTPIAAFYAPRFPALAPVAEPVSEGYYVIYVNKGEPALVQALNEAIILMTRNGELERIYRKYGIWDSAQQQLVEIADASKFYGYYRAAQTEVQPGQMPPEDAVTAGAPERGWGVVGNYGGVLLQSAGMTVVLSVMSFPLAIALGLFVAIGRLYGPRWIKAPLGAYVEFLRGTPLMLQLYFIFFFLPEAGIRVPAFWTAILGLAINYSAYESEIYRAGLQAVPRGQMEAALSLGMSRATSVRRIIAPQAVRMVIPPVVSDFIALYKDTSVCSVITIVELTKRFSVLSMSTQATIELMLMTCALYMLMSYPVAVLSRRLEKRLGVGVAVL